MTKILAPPRHTNGVTAVKMVRQGGDLWDLLKRARRELRKARQARSRRRFAFWTAVATEMESKLRSDSKIERIKGADECKRTAGI